MPKDTEASYALAQSLAMGDERLRELLRLVCVSLSEQALTTDLIDVINNEDIFPTFYLVMKDHVADEGRHARFSQQVLSHIWRHSDAVTKQALQQPILTFLEGYATDAIAKDFSACMLRQLGLTEAEIIDIIADTYPATHVKPWETNNIVTERMLVALNKSGILADLPIADALHAKI